MDTRIFQVFPLPSVDLHLEHLASTYCYSSVQLRKGVKMLQYLWKNLNVNLVRVYLSLSSILDVL